MLLVVVIVQVVAQLLEGFAEDRDSAMRTMVLMHILEHNQHAHSAPYSGIRLLISS